LKTSIDGDNNGNYGNNIAAEIFQDIQTSVETRGDL
jgi:hypothetical protein